MLIDWILSHNHSFCIKTDYLSPNTFFSKMQPLDRNENEPQNKNVTAKEKLNVCMWVT